MRRKTNFSPFFWQQKKTLPLEALLVLMSAVTAHTHTHLRSSLMWRTYQFVSCQFVSDVFFQSFGFWTSRYQGTFGRHWSDRGSQGPETRSIAFQTVASHVSAGGQDSLCPWYATLRTFADYSRCLLYYQEKKLITVLCSNFRRLSFWYLIASPGFLGQYQGGGGIFRRGACWTLQTLSRISL